MTSLYVRRSPQCARSSFYRNRPRLGPSATPLLARTPAARAVPARALSPQERASVLDALHQDRFQDRSPAADIPVLAC